jgi:hypothetical protein
MARFFQLFRRVFLAGPTSPMEFTRAFRFTWFDAMSGGASVPFMVLAAWLDSSWGKAICAALAFACGWLAAYRVWKREKENALGLEERLSPRINAFLDPECNGVRVVETLIPAERRRGPDSKWVQLSVRSTTDAPLIDCETRLLRVERINDDQSIEVVSDEPAYCEWSNSPQDQRIRMNIPAEVAQPANLFSIHDIADAELIPETRPNIKPELLREIQAPGKYRLAIAVSARDAPTVRKSLLLEWNGTYQSLTIACS